MLLLQILSLGTSLFSVTLAWKHTGFDTFAREDFLPDGRIPSTRSRAALSLSLRRKSFLEKTASSPRRAITSKLPSPSLSFSPHPFLSRAYPSSRSTLNRICSRKSALINFFSLCFFNEAICLSQRYAQQRERDKQTAIMTNI